MKMRNGTLIRVDVDKSTILKTIHMAMDEAFSDEGINVKDYIISLERKGDLSFSIDQTVLYLDLPIQIQINKPEGLFSVQGEGALLIKLRIDYEIDEDFNISTRTSIVNHDWLEKPNLSMGVINIPVTSLLNLILRRFDDKLVEMMDDRLKKELDLRKIVLQNLSLIKKGIALPSHSGVMVYVKPKTMHIQKLTDQKGKIGVELLLDMNVLVTDIENEIDLSQFKLSWTAVGTENLHQEVFVSISYDAIATIITEALDGTEVGGKNIHISNTEIMLQEDEITIVIHLESPTQSKFIITGHPHYDMEEGILDLLDYEVEMKASNLLYKLSSPIIEKVIESRVSDALPVRVNDLIKENLDIQIPDEFEVESGKIRVAYKKITVDGIAFEPSGLIAKASITSPELAMHLDLTSLTQVPA